MSVELYSVHQVYKSNHFSLQGKICEEKKKKGEVYSLFTQ